MLRSLLCFMTMLVGLTAWAATAPIVTAKAGFAGKLPGDARLTPVIVTISNRGPGAATCTGRIVLRSNSARPEVAHVMPFESGKDSTKNFVMLTRLQDNARLVCTVEYDQNIATDKPSIAAVRVDEEIVLELGLTKSTYVKEFKADGNAVHDHYRMYSVTEDELTLLDMPLAYDSVAAMVVDPRAFGELPTPVVRAIADWVQLGGSLTFCGPERGNEFIAKLAAFDLVAGDLAEVGTQQYGLGWIAVDGLDPKATAVFLDEDRVEEARALYPRILEGNSRLGTGSMSGGNMGTGLLNMLTQKEGSYGFRGFMWLTLIIVSYLVVIGPLDWWVVKKLGRPYLTWFFFIGSITAFSIVAYWYSSFVHSDVMQAVQINIVDASVNGDQARGESMYWVYSTKNFRYEFGASQPDVIFSMRESSQSAGATASVTVTNGETSTISAKIPIFSAKTLDATWTQKWDYQFGVDTIDGRVSITVPEGMKIRSMQLADQRGLVEMTPGTSPDTWIETGAPNSWKNVQSQYTHNDYDAYFEIAHDDKLPPVDKLDGFIRFISLTHIELREKLPKPEKGDTDAAAQPAPDTIDDLSYDQNGMFQADWRTRVVDTMSARDGRETSLNASSRIHGVGQMVLIFLEDEQLMDVTLNGIQPEKLNVNVIRLQLP